jgi:hypothetical protein
MAKLLASTIAATAIIFAAHAEAKDLGLFYGEPTPAYAMYIAQVNSAAENCASAGMLREKKDAAKFLKHFNNGTEVAVYNKKDEAFAESYRNMQANYKTAFNAASTKVREGFCNSYNSDVADKEGKGLFKFAPQVMYYRYTFSPKSEESLARARKWINILSVGSAVATTSATISAGRDSVAAAKVGDWDSSNQLMAQSRAFNEAGSGIVALGSASQPLPSEAPLIAVTEQLEPDGSMRVIRCPVVDHFFSFTAPVVSPVWTTYMSVHMACRNPVPDDLKRM